jgi:tRNA G46 methylase TrmB
VATDIEDYALQAERVANGNGGLRGGRVSRPGWRIETKYEAKAKAAGRSVIDLQFRRR